MDCTGEILNDSGASGLRKGDKFTIHTTLNRTAFPNAVDGMHRLRIDGKPGVGIDARQLIGWDPVHRTVNTTCYWSDKSVETIGFDRHTGDRSTEPTSILAPQESRSQRM